MLAMPHGGLTGRCPCSRLGSNYGVSPFNIGTSRSAV